MKILSKLILPVGLVIALIFSLVLPEPGIISKSYFGIELTVITIFLISGYLHRFDEISFNGKFLLFLILAAVSNLLILPFIGYFLAKTFLSCAFAVGVIVIVSMPPTLSSGVVITETADGNSVLAILLTVGLNILGLITIPLMISYFFSNTSSVHVDPLTLFWKLLVVIFIPFTAGRLIKKKIFPDIKGIKYIKLIPPLAVVSAVWMGLSASSENLFKVDIFNLYILVLSVMLIHSVFLVFNYIISVIFKTDKKDIEAFIFVVSQKTMPLSIMVLATMSDAMGKGIIACMIYHFMQILYDSVLASFISKRKNKSVTTETGQADISTNPGC
ncbi:MAG: bile acid:sodium symporter [Victivallales bacterium]|nr:bile acid:sodium symporter [Victivallales bacterium]